MLSVDRLKLLKFQFVVRLRETPVLPLGFIQTSISTFKFWYPGLHSLVKSIQTSVLWRFLTGKRSRRTCIRFKLFPVNSIRRRRCIRFKLSPFPSNFISLLSLLLKARLIPEFLLFILISSKMDKYVNVV